MFVAPSAVHKSSRSGNDVGARIGGGAVFLIGVGQFQIEGVVRIFNVCDDMRLSVGLGEFD